MDAKKTPIDLKVDSPLPDDKGYFGLFLTHSESMTDECWESIKAHIEFRRRCMNQGFDNLLELIELTRKTLPKPKPKEGAI